MKSTTFEKLAVLSERLGSTSSRAQMTEMIAQFLKHLAIEEVPAALRLLIGQVFPEWDERTLDLSWRAVSRIVNDLIAPSEEERAAAYSQAVDAGQAVRRLLESSRKDAALPPPPTILEVCGTFAQIAAAKGKGSRSQKEDLLRSLLIRAAPVEAEFLAKNVVREMRHGVSEGLALEAIGAASGARTSLVRRANMLCGDLGEVATTALRDGEAGLRKIKPRLFRPLKPMLAQMAKDLADPFKHHGGNIALEYKLDGARVQIHKEGATVRIFTRNLSEVTRSLPEIAEDVRKNAKADRAIVEGEVIAVDSEGRPLPFQHLMRRFRRVHRIAETAQQVPVQLHLFDILYLGEESLVDLPYITRWRLLEDAKGSLRAVTRRTPRNLADGEAFAEQAYRDGHEGLVAKHLASPYRPGARGKAWFKIKHVVSLDLVIVAADWGYGRRHGWLSNYHLAARDQDAGSFPAVGKTFKGFTDDEFRAMTQQLLDLETHRRGATVFVKPKVVVEVLFNEIQASSQYESGLALRFARIHRLRQDKVPEEADTIQTMRQMFHQQRAKKGQLKGSQGR